MQYLFVYGTLMKKCPQNEWSAFLQENAVYVDEATIEGALYKIDYYPGLVKGKGTVYGEVYTLHENSKILPLLDEYEGYLLEDSINSLYLRDASQVKLSRTDKIIEAWIYYYNRSITDLKRYNSGIFISSE